jgi:DNA-binding transcriptional MerR regulator
VLTIGQLAEHVGVTVRAVRHYHRCGLLAEPDRDASGYRRYDAQAVVDLIRIKTLADAGVPLARIKELITAPPGEFSDAIAQIDETLKSKIRDLTQHRRRIADLAEGGGERLFLPPEIVEILDQLRAIGVSERTVQMERDGWILAVALSPDSVPEWVQEKAEALADPGFRRLYLACDQAFDSDPADPGLAELADQMVRWDAQRRLNGCPPDDRPANPVMVALMTSQFEALSPAWHRLGELSRSLPSSRPPGHAQRESGARCNHGHPSGRVRC